MTDLEYVELAVMRARDKLQYKITNTPEGDRKFSDDMVYFVLSRIANELKIINKDIEDHKE
jgi:hypothetical protein